MNTSKVVHQAKLNTWADLIRDQQSSSLSVASWCEQHQLSKDQYYYWKRKLKDHYVEAQLPDIVPITSPALQQSFTSCTTVTTQSLQSSLTLSIAVISIFHEKLTRHPLIINNFWSIGPEVTSKSYSLITILNQS
ncbi:MAG: hypothetical protein E7294_13205 [Lachnospiraceae bacterium]|nr:hypothetical protein [Lachnospiraceae bacterium]